MPDTPYTSSELTPLQRALLAIERLQARIESLEKTRNQPIAVTGMACRFPGGAGSPEKFWDLLIRGGDAVTETPVTRWFNDELYEADPDVPGKSATRWGAFLQDIDLFDPSYFGISPVEARQMDPQQRILLELAAEALLDAGEPHERITGSKTGVFVGAHSHSSDYTWMQYFPLERSGMYTSTGTAHSILANRISYQFDLKGPSLTVDTACSSSLVSMHLAIQSLRNGECDRALVGGINLMITPESTIALSRLHLMSPSGRCRTFDAGADGMVRGEGGGLVVLKRLTDALASGDRILAVVKGSAVNQDGSTNGITAPSGPAQQEVIRAALDNAGVRPEEITYVETHGTGTKLGDPIECEALAHVLGHEKKGVLPCRLGSVKTNIGHLEGAAGIAGFIKTVLCLKHRRVPPNLHFRHLNPHIRLESSRFVFPHSLESWSVNQGTRKAGVSSFGFGGTNAHVVLEEWIEPEPSTVSDPATGSSGFLIPVSAASRTSLGEQARPWIKRFDCKSEKESLADICFSAGTCMNHHVHRLAVFGSTEYDLRDELTRFLAGEPLRNGCSSRVVDTNKRGVVFVYSGQGTAWPAMGADLFRTNSVFRKAVEEVDVRLKPLAGWSVAEVLASRDVVNVQRSDLAQPALFALQIGLTAVWKSYGIEPDAVIGHSVGEISAACTAGIYDLETAVRIIYHRGRLMQEATGSGKMALIGCPAVVVKEFLVSFEDNIFISAYNGPSSTIVSGQEKSIRTLVEKLENQGVFARMLAVDLASHCSLMNVAAEKLESCLGTIIPHACGIPIYSTVTGQESTGSEWDADYLSRNIREPVRFDSALSSLLDQPFSAILEIAPHPTLAVSIGEILESKGLDLPVLSSMHRDEPSDLVRLETLATLYTQGFPIKWNVLYPGARRVEVPSYAWDRQRYWLDYPPLHRQKPVGFDHKEDLTRENTDPDVSFDTERIDNRLRNWVYEVGWEPLNDSDDLFEEWSVERFPKIENWLLGGVKDEISLAFKAKLVELGLVVDWFEDQTDVRTGPERSVSSSFLSPENGTDSNVYQEVVFFSPPNSRFFENLRYDSGTARRLSSGTVYSALSLVQWAVHHPERITGRVWFVTRGAVCVPQDELDPDPEQAMLWGLGRSISLAEPRLWGGLIDIDPQEECGRVTDHLMYTLTHPTEDQVVLRGNRGWVPRLVRSEGLVARTLSISTDHAYLITGGLGGLGIEIARWLIWKGAKHIVLASRSPLPDDGMESEISTEDVETRRRIQAVRSLRETGAHIHLATVDVGAAAEMVRMMARFGAEWPPLRGVFHAAALIQPSKFAGLNADRLEQTIRPKVDGAVNLLRWTDTKDLDFVVLFSSAAGLFGATEMPDYAAANAFLDACATTYRRHGCRMISLDWGAWETIRSLGETEVRKHERSGFLPMKTIDALEVMEALIGSDRAQLAVFDAGWDDLKALYDVRQERAFLKHFQSSARPDRQGRKEKPKDQELLAQLSLPDRKSWMEKLVAEEVNHILGFSENQPVDYDRGFFEQGFDSLQAMTFRKRVLTRLGVDFQASAVFNYSTVRSFAAFLLERLPAPAISRPEDRYDTDKELNDLSGLSTDSLAAMLDDELTRLLDDRP